MNAKKCDRCGKFYEQYNNHPSDDDEQPNRLAFMREYGVYIKNEDKICSFDLCEQCMDKVNNWIKSTDMEVIEK